MIFILVVILLGFATFSTWAIAHGGDTRKFKRKD